VAERAAPPWWVSTVVVFVALGALAWFVWPTRWQYFDSGHRRDRLTGAYEMRIATGHDEYVWITRVLDDETGAWLPVGPP
jgi:hypothetical protein